MKAAHIIAAVLAGCIGLARPALCASHFVSFDGDDGADGSQAHPWRTVEHAVELLKPGDELILMAGTYPAGFKLSHLVGADDGPITVRTADNARVLIDLSPNGGPGIQLKNCTHVVLRGLEVSGVTVGAGIALRDCNHCSVEGNVVHDCQGIGIRLFASNHNVLRGNICYHNDSGIYIGTGSTRNLVEGNVCAFGNKSSENADGIGSSDCVENTYRYNLVIGNNDDGLDMWTSKRCLIEYNYARANGDQREGDGNGFKLGGKWKNRPKSDPWDGGGHTVRYNLSVDNLSTGFTDNGSTGNKYEGNVAFGNRNTGSYASVKHTDPSRAEPIRNTIRQHLARLIAAGLIRPHVNPLPADVAAIRKLDIWPQ